MAKKNEFTQYPLRSTWIILLLVVFSVVLLLLIVNTYISNLTKEQVYNRLSDTVAENTRTIRLFLNERTIDLESFSRLEINELQEIERFSDFFQSLLRETNWYDFILAADLNGNVLFSINEDIQANIAERKYFQVAKQGQPVISGVFFSDVLNRPVMIFSHPLYGEQNRVLGVLAAAINLPKFYDLLFDLSLSETQEFFLIDDQGTMLSPTRLGGRPLIDKAYSQTRPNPHTGEKGITTHLDYRNQKVLCAYEKIPELSAYLVSEIDLDEALLPVRKISRSILYIFIPVFLLLMALSSLYSRRTTSLLIGLNQDLQKALAGVKEQKLDIENVNQELKTKIEEGKKLTGELKASEAYIRLLLDSISFGVISLHRQGLITHTNLESRQMFPTENLKVGADFFSNPSLIEIPELKHAFLTALEKGKVQKIQQKSVLRDGNERFFNFTLFPFTGNQGEVSDVTLFIEDISERKRIREQMAEYEKLNALSQLALGAAHEINNPLLGISSFLEILSEETQDPDSKNEIALVLENVYRISETIRGLLNFARPSPPQFTNINLNHLIEETLAFLKHQPIFRKIEMQKNLSSVLPSITADLNQLRQVLINIFLNAAQSMPNGGRLKITSEKVKFKELVQIQISDSGIGISSENLKKIFHPFFTTKKNLGTGLGLSISLSLIKNHRGEISVQSCEGEGTTFTISLPIRQAGNTDQPDEEIIL